LVNCNVHWLLSYSLWGLMVADNSSHEKTPAYFHKLFVNSKMKIIKKVVIILSNIPLTTSKNRTQIEFKSLEDFTEKNHNVRFIDAFIEK